jgi:hypothetical protein
VVFAKRVKFYLFYQYKLGAGVSKKGITNYIIERLAIAVGQLDHRLGKSLGSITQSLAHWILSYFRENYRAGIL